MPFNTLLARETDLSVTQQPARWQRRLGNWALWLGPIGLGVFLTLAQLPLVARLQNLVFDGYQTLSPRPWQPDLPVRVVDIDEPSLARYGQWPWPRDRMALLTRKLQEFGAAAIGFDVIFAERDQTSPGEIAKRLPAGPERQALEEIAAKNASHEDLFAQALAEAPSLLAFVATNEGGEPPPKMKAGFAFAGDDPGQFLQHFTGTILPLASLLDAASGLAAITLSQDHDQIVRQVPLLYALAGKDGTVELAPSLGAEALRIAQQASTIVVKSSNASGEAGFGANTGITAVKIGDLEIPTDRNGTVRVRFSGYQKKRHISVVDLLEDKVERAEIEGRIALVGSSAAGLGDIRATPLEGSVPGTDIYAELIEHVTSAQHLVRPDFAPGLEAFLIVLGGLLIGLLVRRLKALGAAIGAAVLIGGVAVASFALFLHRDLLIDPLMPAATWLSLYGTLTVAAFRRTERERRAVREAFSRYLAPAVVARLVADPSKLKLGGELRHVTILFSDARNFTARSETLDAQGVVDFLNRLHTPLTAAVLDHGGTIDKYIGDGLMAFWNAPLDVNDHANAACRAALDMLAAIPAIDAAMRAEAEAKGRPHVPVRIGIGINTGDVFVGNMGSDQRFDYSIVGDPVNVAARLESATKERGVDILVSESTAAAASDFRFRALGEVDLKGKSQATAIFTIDGKREP